MKPAISARVIFNNLKNRLLSHTTYQEKEASELVFWLLEHTYQLAKIDILADKKFKPEEQIDQKLYAYLARLEQHEPIQYIIGEAPFLDFSLQVNSAVLIPRPETEELVLWVMQEIIISPLPCPAFLDIGTGSGCIAIALKKKIPQSQVFAIDISPQALEVAVQNADLQQVEINFREMDILKEENYAKMPMFDVIVSNPPYISAEEKNLMPANVLEFEPHTALFAPKDTHHLIFYEKIALFAQKNLNPQGYIFFELNEYETDAIAEIVEKKGFQEIEIKTDLQGKKRMMKIQK